MQIYAKISSIEEFMRAFQNQANAILEIASRDYSKCVSFTEDVSNALEESKRQAAMALSIVEDADRAIERIESDIDEIQSVIDELRSEIAYLEERPINITETDSEGNETTKQSVDYQAIAALEARIREYEEAMRPLVEKRSEASRIRAEANELYTKLCNMVELLSQMLSRCQEDLSEIIKLANAVKTDGAYVLGRFNVTLASLSSYVSSKSLGIGFKASFLESSSKALGGYGGFSSFGRGGASSSRGSSSFKRYSMSTGPTFLENEEYAALQKEHLKAFGAGNSVFLRKYTAKCDDINGYLRGTKKFEYSFEEESMKEIADGMTDAISNCHLGKDAVLLRGVTDLNWALGENPNFDLMSIEELNESYVGKEFSDKGFFSTSNSYATARGFTSSVDATIFRVSIPGGFPAAVLGDISVYGTRELEVLLQRGSVFRVTGFAEGDGVMFIDIDAIGVQGG